jgi:imidazolonepropionase-like amidohydrolase
MFGRIMTAIVLCLLVATSLFASDVVAITGGTVLTITKGTIENGTVLIEDGKIIAVGKDLEIPAGAKIIDASGAFVMPGIVDGHSHIAMSGINEISSPVTPQVDMSDAILTYDYSIYRALAGGVTSAKLMHGSANVIGGLCVTVKLKWGQPLDEMRIPGARPQLKFALGENPTRLYGGKGQMPSTRPGEFAIIRQQFLDARDYQAKWKAYEAKVKEGKEASAPKRNLKMETLVKVLEGEYTIDCHAYSAHEIVTMLKVADEFDLPLQCLSHVLEAYKVIDDLKKYPNTYFTTHTDWWGYKWEAYDAIPYTAGMLHKAGIKTTLISDSGDVIRRLNREAAKVVKYSGISETDALAMITINAANSLEIGNRTGSIEVGKDADIAIFDKHPLDSFGKCIMTLIEGKVWFDINDPKTALMD